jgi:hypothetical protein
MLTTLYKIELRRPDRNPKHLAIVRDVNGCPDHRQLRDALPRAWREGFMHTHWLRDPYGMFAVVRGARGRVLGSIWATPYEFNP